MPTDISPKVEPEHGCRSCWVPPVRFSGSGAGDLIQTEVGENRQVDTGLFGRWGQRVHLAPERDGVANFPRSLETGPENTATRELQL